MSTEAPTPAPDDIAQDTQRVTLPHADDSLPSVLKIRINASVPGVFGSNNTISWSKAVAASAAIARASSGRTPRPVLRRSRIVISLPNPFIFR
jgi:hypothetical protein